jgi:hypothetical protein
MNENRAKRTASEMLDIYAAISFDPTHEGIERWERVGSGRWNSDGSVEIQIEVRCLY